MAFVNAYLTEEEKARFSEAKIPDPRWNLPKYCLDPRRWTIDKEREIALINCGVADRDNYEIETFAFVNTHIEKRQVLSFNVVRKYQTKEKNEMLKKKYNVELVKNWDLIGIDNFKKFSIVPSFENFVELLSEALTVYGVDGEPGLVLSVKALVEVKCGGHNA